MSVLADKLDRARWTLLQDYPFYGALAMRLADKIGDARAGETASTDGRAIYWGEDFLAGLSEAETLFVLAHETMHCAHGHLWRFDFSAAGGVAEKSNAACDYVINQELSALPGFTMPKSGLLDPKYAGMCEEDVFHALPDEARAPSVGACLEPAGPGSEAATPEEARAASEALRDAWAQATVSAAQAAKSRGMGGEAVERALSKARAVQPDWRQALASTVRRAQSCKNDWSRSSRRGALSRTITPRRTVDALSRIVVVRDTSGSIDDATLAAFNAAIAAILVDCATDAIVLDADYRVCAEYEIGAGDDLPSTAKGGGGTSFKPALARAADLNDDAPIAGVVYLTDLCGDFPDAAPDFPVLWASTEKNGRAPFGDVLYINVK